MPSSRSRKRFLFVLAAISGLFVCAFFLVLIILLIMSHAANSVRLPESLKRPPALPPELSAWAQSSTPAIHPVALAPGELATIKTYQDYLQLRLARDPSRLSIMLYLQTLRRDHDESIEGSFDKLGPSVFDSEISPKEASWLKTHQGFIAQLHRLAQAGPIPHPSLEELAAIARVNASYNIMDGLSFIRHATQILARDALRQMKTKDFNASCQSLRDALRLWENLSGRLIIFDQLSNMVILGIVATPLQVCIENPRFPVSELQSLASDLERVEQTMCPPGRMARAFYNDYLMKRLRIIDAMDHATWTDPEFNPNRVIKVLIPGYYDYLLSLPGGRKFNLPRLDRYLLEGLGAMYNRRHAAEALQQADRFYTRELAAAQPIVAGQSSVMAETSETTFTGNFILALGPKKTHGSISNRTVQEFEYGARLRLIRLGIAWRVDPKATLARRGEDFRNDLFHPWRDPFTGQPFLADATSSPTLIYSPGPDRRDQHGSDSSDDIAIRIPGS